MKKVFLLACLAFCLASCKKKYNCACTVTIIENSSGLNQFTSTSDETYSVKMKESQAKSACANSAAQIQKNEDAAIAPDFHTNVVCNITL